MKRIIRIISCAFSVLIALLLVSCASTTDSPNESALEIGQPGYIGTSDEGGLAFDPALQIYEDNLINELQDTVPYTNITVTCELDQFSVGVSINNRDKITYFGNYVLEVRAAFESLFDETQRDGLAVVLEDNGNDLIAYFNHDLGDNKAGSYGIIADRRGSISKYTALDSVESLCEIFPATYIFMGKSDIDPSVLAIYEEVLKILDEQYDRPEDEILEELAPQYNMTVVELKQLIEDVMSQIYS